MHLDLLTAQYVHAGASPAEARRMARAKFGGVTQIKESTTCMPLAGGG